MGNLLKGTSLTQLRKIAEAARSYVVERIGDIVGTVADAIEELAEEVDKKADKPVCVSFAIPVDQWSQSGRTDYPYRYTIATNVATAETRADIIFDAESVSLAYDAGVSAACESIAGGVVLWTECVPAKTLAGALYLS